MKKNFPKLYKTDSKGKTRVWEIWAEDETTPTGGYASYAQRYGEENGRQQTTRTDIQVGKNIGKANETTPFEQACSEAESKWNKKQDGAYRTEKAIDFAGNHILAVAKVHLPMLAQSYDKHARKIVFPCLAQPKLDGVRCEYIVDSQYSQRFLSRKGKMFALPHMESALSPLDMQGWVLDGELYVHGMGFQTITSIVRKEIHPRKSELEYHVYDCYNHNHPDATFKERTKILSNLLAGCTHPIVIVPTFEIKNASEVTIYLTKYEKLGYEGIMLRNKHSLYENDKRSYDLQKVKSFKDAEFKIVGGKECVGRDVGSVCFNCVTEDGKPFDCRPEGTLAERKEYWENLDKYVGQYLTVKYFDLTDDGIPRFPVGLTIRNFE